MISKQIKGYSAFLVIREMQTNKYTPIRIAAKKLLTIPNFDKEVEKLESSCSASKSLNWQNHFGKLAVFTKAEHTHSLWPSSSTPMVYT